MEEKKYDKALILYRFYPKAFPNIVVAWNSLGDIYLSQGKQMEAINAINKHCNYGQGNQEQKKILIN